MKNNFLKIIVASVILFATSCSHPATDLSIYIPKDAAAVFVVDPKSIADKIASSGITIDSLANLFANQKDEYALRWNDIKNSGIDLTKSIYIYSKATNSIQQGAVTSGALIANIKDAKQVEAFFKKEKIGRDVKSANNYKYYQLGEDFIAGWTDKVLIITKVSGGNSAPGNYNTGEGTLSQQLLTTLFTQKESESIAAVDAFHDAVTKNGDIHFYTTASTNLMAAPVPGITKLETLMEGSYTSGIINFEKGKAIATTEFHAGKELQNIVTKYPQKEINTGILKSYPDTLTGFGIVSFNPKILLDVLHYVGFDMMIDGFASNLGFTSADIVNALSGDIAFMASPGSAEATEKITPDNNIQTKQRGHFIVSFSIGDKAAFNKIIAGLTSKGLLTKNGDYYQLGEAGGHSFIIAVINDKLLIASDENIVSGYNSSTQKAALPQAVEKEINNKSMAVYFDINNMLNTNSGSSSNFSLRGKQYNFANGMQAAKSTFKNFIGTSDKGNGNVYNGNFELNFINDNENSLASLARFLAFVRTNELKNNNGKDSMLNQAPDSLLNR